MKVFNLSSFPQAKWLHPQGQQDCGVVVPTLFQEHVKDTQAPSLWFPIVIDIEHIFLQVFQCPIPPKATRCDVVCYQYH